MQIIHSANVFSSAVQVINDDNLVAWIGGNPEEAKQVISLLRDCHKKKATELRLFNFYSITRLPPLPKNLTSLIVAGCINLKKLPALPSDLVSLDIYMCGALEELPSLPPGLANLKVTGGDALEKLPTLPDKLKKLLLNGCGKLTELPRALPSLYELEVSWCCALKFLPPSLPSTLVSLNISGCDALTGLPDLPLGLMEFCVTDCSALTELPNVSQYQWMSLNLLGCCSLLKLPDSLPRQLISLNLTRCHTLKALPSLLPKGLIEANIITLGCTNLGDPFGTEITKNNKDNVEELALTAGWVPESSTGVSVISKSKGPPRFIVQKEPLADNSEMSGTNFMPDLLTASTAIDNDLSKAKQLKQKKPVEGLKLFLPVAENGNTKARHRTGLIPVKGWGMNSKKIMGSVNIANRNTFDLIPEPLHLDFIHNSTKNNITSFKDVKELMGGTPYNEYLSLGDNVLAAITNGTFPTEKEVILKNLTFSQSDETVIPENVILDHCIVTNGRVCFYQGVLTSTEKGAIADACGYDAKAIASAEGAIAIASAVDAIAFAVFAKATALAIVAGSAAVAKVAGARACGHTGGEAYADADGSFAFAMLNVTDSSTATYATAKGATSFANVAGAIAVAEGAGTIAEATAGGAFAYARTTGALAIAGADGAIAWAIAAVTSAFAVTAGAKAIARAARAEAIAMVPKSTSYAAVSGALAIAAEDDAQAFANAANSIAGADAAGARAFACVPNSKAIAVVGSSHAFAITDGAKSIARAAAATAWANVRGAEARATVEGAVAKAISAGASASAAAANANAFATVEKSTAYAVAAKANAYADASGAEAVASVADAKSYASKANATAYATEVGAIAQALVDGAYAIDPEQFKRQLDQLIFEFKQLELTDQNLTETQSTSHSKLPSDLKVSDVKIDYDKFSQQKKGGRTPRFIKNTVDSPFINAKRVPTLSFDDRVNMQGQAMQLNMPNIEDKSEQNLYATLEKELLKANEDPSVREKNNSKSDQDKLSDSGDRFFGITMDNKSIDTFYPGELPIGLLEESGDRLAGTFIQSILAKGSVALTKKSYHAAGRDHSSVALDGVALPVCKIVAEKTSFPHRKSNAYLCESYALTRLPATIFVEE